MAAPEVERCDMTDLPVGQCGGSCCQPELTGFETKFVPIQIEGTWREAQYPGMCRCGCEQRFDEGVEIILADCDGSGVNDAWCLLEHTRIASSLFGGGC